MKNQLKIPVWIRLVIVAMLGVVLYNCTSEKYTETTDETVNITEYLRTSENDYSKFLEVLRATNYDSFLNTYGTYTLFLPTNEAVEAYLDDLGATSVADVPVEELQEMVKLHILESKFLTTDFNDGKIAAPSMQGQYLITGALNTGGTSDIVVNKEAKIITSNVIVGNGVMHVIDKVLRVAKNTLAEEIESRDSLSIFTKALKETGWYDKLNQPITYDADSITSHLSVIAQTDAVFAEAGYDTYADLKSRYSTLGEPMNPKDSLNLFMAYRVLPGLKYMADLVNTTSHSTEAPQEVIGVKLSKDTILINEQTFNGVLEKGVVLNRDQSDITTSNGVLHLVNGNFEIKKRFPAPVYFDVGDQPEIRRLAAVFRIPGQTASFAKEDLQYVDWEGSEEVTYGCDTPNGGTYGYGYFADVMEVYRLRDGYINNITFTTPVIIKGRYKVWISYRASPNATDAVNAYFDDELLSRQVNFTQYGITGQPERVLESQGYKLPAVSGTNRFNGRLLGVIDVETTGRHTIRFDSQVSSGQQSWFDVIEFRPVEMDQIYPKLSYTGELVYEE